MKKVKVNKTFSVLAAAMAISLSVFADGLPSGYHRLEWADTDGIGWINTLYRPDCTNAVEMKASVTQSSQFLYCSRHNYEKRVELYIDRGLKPRFAYNTTAGVVTLEGVATGEPCVFTQNPDPDDSYKCNCSASFGETVNADSITGAAEFTPNENAYFCLFGSYTHASLADNTTISYKATCRFFHFKVWDTKDKSELKCHIVPVYGKAEKAVGLYDLVAGRFLPVKGGGTFTTGKITLSQDECWTEMDDMFTAGLTVDLDGHNLTVGTVATNAVSAANPAYQDLEYVTADGSKANEITDFRIPGTAKVEVKVRPGSVSGTPFIFCSREDATTRTYTALIQNERPRFDFHAQNDNRGSMMTAGEDYAFVFDGSGGAGNKASWTVNGEAQNESSGNNDFTSGSDLVVLGSGIDQNTMSGRIYYFTVTADSTGVLLDLRPVRRLSDGVVGLYDRVGGGFYTNGFASVRQPVSLAITSDTAAELRVGQKPLQGGSGYADVSAVFAQMEIASEVTIVKNGASAFDGGGTSFGGKLVVNAGTVGGLTLLDGATLDISSLADSFSLDDNALSFADGATILVDVGTRRLRSDSPVLSWTAAPANLAGLKFLILSGGKALVPTTGNDGLYIESGLVIFIR